MFRERRGVIAHSPDLLRVRPRGKPIYRSGSGVENVPPRRWLRESVPASRLACAKPNPTPRRRKKGATTRSGGRLPTELGHP